MAPRRNGGPPPATSAGAGVQASSVPEDLDLRAVGVPAAERHVQLVRPVIVKGAGPHTGACQPLVEIGDGIGAAEAEADVHALGQCLVADGRRREEGEEEPGVVLEEVPAFGLKGGAEAEVPLVEVPGTRRDRVPAGLDG